MAKDAVQSNLNISKYITISANIVGAILFFVAYKIGSNAWFLFAAIMLLCVAMGAFVFFNYLNNKINGIMNQSQDNNGL